MLQPMDSGTLMDSQDISPASASYEWLEGEEEEKGYQLTLVGR
jgi:hypothetical protein